MGSARIDSSKREVYRSYKEDLAEAGAVQNQKIAINDRTENGPFPRRVETGKAKQVRKNEGGGYQRQQECLGSLGSTKRGRLKLDGGCEEHQRHRQNQQ